MKQLVNVPELWERHAIEPLPLDEDAAAHVHRLPPLHRDPFDRMLICQAIVHGLAVLKPDESIAQYPVRVLWEIHHAKPRAVAAAMARLPHQDRGPLGRKHLETLPYEAPGSRDVR